MSDDLYDAMRAAKIAGESTTLWTRRCEKRCLLIGAYSIRGSIFVLAPGVLDSEGHKVKTAWRADELPQRALLGCKHKGRTTAIAATIHAEGIIEERR